MVKLDLPSRVQFLVQEVQNQFHLTGCITENLGHDLHLQNQHVFKSPHKTCFHRHEGLNHLQMLRKLHDTSHIHHILHAETSNQEKA